MCIHISEGIYNVNICHLCVPNGQLEEGEKGKLVTEGLCYWLFGVLLT